MLKAWLAKKGLRGVYKGGIGSYSLALLALHALQRKAHDDARAAEAAAEAAGTEAAESASAAVPLRRRRTRRATPRRSAPRCCTSSSFTGSRLT